MLLALFMIITSFPLNAFAAQTETNVRNEITDIRTVGDKQVINLGNVRGEKPQLRFFSRSARLFGATTPQARSSSETVAQKVEINLNTMGLNLEEDQFDPSALTEVGSFDVEITFKELGGTRTETRTMTFQAGEIKKTETFYLPKDFGNGNVEAEIPELKKNIALRVYVGAGGTTNFTLGQDMTYKFELTQIVHPVIDLKVVDPYGKELKENIEQALGLKLALEEGHEFDLPANTKSFNIRSLSDFAGDNVADLNDAGDNPTLSLTTTLDKNKRLKVGDKTYKLNKITYKAIGQEVEINGQKKKVGGYIEFATQPKIVVPTPDDSGDLPKTPDGYKRLSFHAETSANANDGKFENGEKLKVIDVLEGTKYTDKELLASIAKVENPTPLLNGRPDDNKKFLKWNPALPTDKTTGEVKDTDYYPVYLADGGEITPGEKLPDGVFEVKVVKDDTIAADPLYGKSYGVFTGSKLSRDKFPDLEAAAGHQNPKWTTEAEDSATAMVDIAKPWTKVITKATTFKATAAEKAATKIGKDGLKAVDTTALQGQELDEKFWHKGVELADNTPADKKNAFAALLKDATVTDITNPARTTAEAGDKVGTLLVTFKDGSTLEVPNQKLIVKPNTVTVAFNKAEGKEHPLRDGDTTVKGKITASSNSDKFPVILDGALVTIKKGDTVLSRTLAKADGSFVAGVKDPLVAGEDISVVVTLPESKTESAPVTEKVQLNPDKLNSIIPTGEAVVKNLEGKKGVDQTKVATLKADIQKAYNDLVEKAPQGKKQKDQKAKSTVTVDADGQKLLDNQYEAIKKAIEELRGNSAPIVNGTTSHKEIFKGDTLDLEDGITVTDKDSTEKVSDIAQVDNKDFTYKVEKIEKDTKTEITKENLAKINQTPGTYEVTYTAKDKSGAEGKFVMTLVVKEPVVEIKDNFPEVTPEGYVKVEFKEGAHGTLEGTTKFLVKDGSAKTVLNAPTIKPNVNYEATKDANWKPVLPDKFTGTEENKKSFTFTAQYTYIGKDVVEQKPGDKKPDVPGNFVKVEFKKGDHGVISSEYTTIYWVNPERNKTLKDIKKPEVTALEGYKFTGWDKEDSTNITAALDVTAQYKAKVVTEDPHDANYVTVDFDAKDHGTLEGTSKFWVYKNEKVSITAPTVTAKAGYTFNKWDPAVKDYYAEATVHNATYTTNNNVSDTKVEGYNKVTFKPGIHGTLTEKSVWVKPDTVVDLNDKAPTVTPEKDYSHIGWKPGLVGKFENNAEIIAQYSNNISDTPVEGWTELTFDQGDHGKFAKGAKNVKWVNPKAELKLSEIAPAIVADTNYSLDGWKDGETKVELETAQKFETAKIFTATYKSNVLGKDEYEKLPEDEKKNFVKITFDKGANGKFPKEAVTEAYVKKDVEVDLTEKAPTVIPNQGYGHNGWNPALKGTFSTASTITAQYKEGTFDENAIKEIIVLGPTKMGYGEGEKLDLTGLKVIAKDDAGLQKTYEGVDVITKAGFTIAPANETVLTKDHNGQPIKVSKGAGQDKVTGQTETTLTIHENKSAKAEDVKALNQNKVVDGKVTNEPKNTTTVTGKAKPGSTVIIKNESGDEIGKVEKVGEEGTFTAEVTKQDEGKKVKVVVTEEGKQPSDTVEATVARDANNDGKADDDANQKTATPTAKALNQGANPTATTITGKAEPGAKVVAKVGDQIVGEATAGQDGNYTIQAKQNEKQLAEDTEVKVTAQAEGKLVSDPTATVVKIDKDGNGVDDKKEQFDIKKATKVEILQNPDKMNYSVTEKAGKTPFYAKGVIIRLTDASGKTATYNYDDVIKEENKGKFTLSPADKEQIGLKEDGSANTIPFTVTVTGAEAQPSATAKENITVILDKDGNGVDDRTETTPEPNVIARNIGTDGPDGKKVPATKTTVEVKTEKNADVTIEYKDANGDTKTITGKADDQGKLTKEITPKLKDGTDVKVTVQDGEKKPTDKTVKVFDDLDGDKIPDTKAGQTERPAALASNIGKKPTFTTITGEAEKGATVTAKVGTQVVGTATADKTTGKYTIQAKQNNSPIKEGVKIDVTATLAPKAESLKQTVVVFNDTDGTGQPDSAKDFDVKKTTGMQVVASPDKMVYSDGDKLNLDGLKVLLTDVNGNQKIFTYKNADNSEFTNAGLSVDLKQETVLSSKDYDAQTAKDGHNGRKLVVTLDTTGNTSAEKAITGQTPTALTVNKNQSAQPTDVVAANQGDATVTKVKGKATKDAEIKITDASGQSLLPEGTTIKADANGDFTADLNKLLNPGTKVFVTATEPGKSESPKAETTVIRDKDGNWKPDTGAKLSTPVIDPIREKDEKVVVAAPKVDDKIQTIEVSDQNGKTVRLTKDPADTTGKTWIVEGSDPAEKVTENNEGKLEIPVKDKLPLNDRDQIKVTFKDGENPANEAFDKASVQKASQTPKVDPVYTGDKNVKIADPTVADPTAKTIKVKVGDKDSMTVEKQPDGSWKVKEDPNKEVKVEDGKIVVPLDPSAKKGDVIKVSTINDSGKASPEAKVTVEDKEKSTTPEVNPVSTNDTKITGKAGPNADVVITITPKDGGTPKEINAKADKEGNFSVPADGLKDGDTIVAKATEKDKAPAESAPVTVGVDKSKLIKAIDDGDKKLEGKDPKDYTPADKKLKEAIEEGKKVEDNPNASQNDVNEKTKAIEDAIKEKEETDKALKELEEAKKELDKTIKDARDDKKPKERIKKGQDSSKEAGTVIDKKGKDKDDKDLTSDQIKKLVEKTKEADRILKLPVIQVTIDTAVDNGNTVVFTTNPGRCKVIVNILRNDLSQESFETETGPGGTGSILLTNPLKAGDSVTVKATRITEDRPVPDYLDNSTSTEI